jgi:DNA polymerase-3 subunit delta'
MNLTPINQKILYGFKNEFNELVQLCLNGKLPNKILITGQKGIGKCTFALHLINYILSTDEEYSYDLKNYTINENNKSFKLILNKTNPNFTLIDIDKKKKFIEIDQIRVLIKNLNKSSFNQKKRFVLIDNIEFLNINSINALLKILEEPNQNINFILIGNNKNILPTLTSRCINFKLSLTYDESVDICLKLLDHDIYKLINKDLVNYYLTPGKIYLLINFFREKNIDLTKYNLRDFIKLIISENYYKNDLSIKFILYEFIELFLINKISNKSFDLYNYFMKQINKVKKFNLDEESLFIELKSELINE